jgi:hypothetical protein
MIFSPNVINDGLIFYIDAANKRCYPGSGTDGFDLIHSNDVSFGNGASVDSGNGGSFSLDGVNDYINIGSVDSSNPLMLYNSDFTIQCFINWVGTGDASQRIFSKSSTGSGNDGYDLWIDEGSLDLGGSIDGSNFETSARPSDNTWTNVAWVSNGTGNTIYMDGVAYSGTYYGGGSHKRPPNVTTNARIGSWNSSAARIFNGKISFIKIYNRELSASEILQNLNALKDRFI